VAHQQTRTLGDVGNIMVGVSSNLPLFGLGVKLIGEILAGIDANIQAEKIHNFALFALTNNEMEVVAEKIAR
ncbi:hypothetical protein, partial [Salmonella enterica]|uniref:hypothetical protein n=1 Tax=Salmonella enterica TaxID=28901 RepID=UPI003298085B